MGMEPGNKWEDLNEELELLWEGLGGCMSVSVGCWTCVFRTKGFASSAAHGPAHFLEKCLLQRDRKLHYLSLLSLQFDHFD